MAAVSFLWLFIAAIVGGLAVGLFFPGPRR